MHVIYKYIYRFLHLDLVDLNAEQFVFEIIVEIETVSILHVFSPRVLVEDSCFSAGQWLQSTPELSLLCTGESDNVIQQVPLTQQNSCATYLKTCVTYASGSANLLHAELLSFIEHQQHQCLEQRDLQLLLTLQDTIVILKAVHSRSLSLSSMLC